MEAVEQGVRQEHAAHPRRARDQGGLPPRGAVPAAGDGAAGDRAAWVVIGVPAPGRSEDVYVRPSTSTCRPAGAVPVGGRAGPGSRPRAVRAARTWCRPSTAVWVTSAYCAGVYAVVNWACAARWRSVASASACRAARSSPPFRVAIPPPSRSTQRVASAPASAARSCCAVGPGPPVPWCGLLAAKATAPATTSASTTSAMRPMMTSSVVPGVRSEARSPRTDHETPGS